jgi:hypothetical protein
MVRTRNPEPTGDLMISRILQDGALPPLSCDADGACWISTLLLSPALFRDSSPPHAEAFHYASSSLLPRKVTPPGAHLTEKPYDLFWSAPSITWHSFCSFSYCAQVGQDHETVAAVVHRARSFP